MSKKNILITLGCSMTEGVGCYDYTRNVDLKKYLDLPLTEREYQRKRFHKLGWPNRVGKLLGFDKVLNLGKGGSANSAHLKIFTERVLNNHEFDDYNVYVIWMLTEPTRISFYDGNKVRSYLPNKGNSAKSGRILGEAYIREVKNIELGAYMEQIFYMKLMEQTCQNNNFKLIHVYWSRTKKGLLKIYNSEYNLFNDTSTLFTRAGIAEETKSKVCGHPNEKGYEQIANVIVRGVESYRPEFKVGPINEDVEWEWRGSIAIEIKNIKKLF